MLFQVSSQYQGFPGGLDGTEFTPMQKTWVQSLRQKL